MKKAVCLILCVSICGLAFISCGDKKAGNEKPAPNENQTIAEQIPEINIYEDDLPEMDFNGESFRILDFPTYTNAHANLVEAEETGDVVIDAIYRANANVEERFNVAFDEIVCEGYVEALKMMRNSVQSGSDDYDFVLITDRDAFATAMEGKYFYAFDELPHVNLDKAYWDQSLRKTLSMGNRLYFTYGANMLSVNDFSCIMLFNKRIAEDLGLGNIYQLVRDGKWTIDKMTEMAKAATKDMDGNGTMNKEDRYGIASRGDYFYASFWVCERIPLIGKDKDDLPYFNAPGNEKLFDIFGKLNEISKSDYIWQGTDTGSTDPPMEMFSKGNSLFFSSTVYTTWRLRGMEIDYGIIPYPTLKEKNPGEPYSARAQGGFPIVIPATSDAARGSAIMEALACQYQKHVMSPYYENTIQIKATRDEESIEMIDMLLTNKFMDLGDCIWTMDARHEYTTLFFKKQGDAVVSKTEAIAQKLEAALQTARENLANAPKR